MAGARLEAGQRVEPEPGAEPVEQRSGVVRRPGSTGHADLLGAQLLDGKGGEDRVLDPETGIDRIELADQ